jgi:hypothetical protein
MEMENLSERKGVSEGVSFYTVTVLLGGGCTNPARSVQREKGLLIVASRWCQKRPAHDVSWSERNHQTGSDIAVKHIQLSNSIPDRHYVHELDWVPS